MQTQNAKQYVFLAYAFGVPLKYSGKSLEDAHKHLLDIGLNETHSDAVKDHLLSTLGAMGVEENSINQVSEIVESTREHVLGR